MHSSALRRIRAEYEEMPGLTLTSAQVARLCGIDTHACLHVLESLVEAGYLDRTIAGRYVRPGDPRRTRATAAGVVSTRRAG